MTATNLEKGTLRFFVSSTSPCHVPFSDRKMSPSFFSWASRSIPRFMTEVQHMIPVYLAQPPTRCRTPWPALSSSNTPEAFPTMPPSVPYSSVCLGIVDSPQKPPEPSKVWPSTDSIVLPTTPLLHSIHCNM